MSNQTPTEWFLQKVFKDLFVLSLIFWGALFVLELVKTGIVSNYLSLPHLAIGVVVLGILALVFDNNSTVSQLVNDNGITQKHNLILMVTSLIIAVVILLATNLSAVLTLLLIFVTVLALWVTVYSPS